MAISNELAARINAMYASPTTVAEQIAAANAASNLISAPRVVTTSGPVRQDSDYRLLVNATAGTPSLTLPSGIDGMTYAVAHHPSNTVAWTLTPASGNTVATPLSSAIATQANVNMQFLGGVWQKI